MFTTETWTSHSKPVVKSTFVRLRDVSKSGMSASVIWTDRHLPSTLFKESTDLWCLFRVWKHYSLTKILLC